MIFLIFGFVYEKSNKNYYIIYGKGINKSHRTRHTQFFIANKANLG